MTVRVFRSTDSGAPVLTGQAGSLVALLDACLVNGYGSQAAAGWSIAFTGTNLRAYLQPAGSNGFYLRVNDTTTTYASVVGYETMSDINTGTGPFPTAAQMANGVFYVKSTTADATARPWALITNGKIIYLLIEYGTPGTATGNIFGDITSYKSGDLYATLQAGSATNNAASYFGQLIVGNTGALNAHYIARTFAQTGSSLAVNKGSDTFRSQGATTVGYTGNAYPDPIDGGLHLAPLFIGEPGNVVRGVLPGVWNPMHSLPLAHNDTFSGSGALAGKTFLALKVFSGNQTGMVAFETSNTW